MDSASSLRRLLEESSIPLESDAARQLSSYVWLLEKWNARINLTSSTEWRILGPMIREGLWAASFYPASASRHLDIGSGAGFPALLLKVLTPRMRLDLVESREKKGLFLETAASSLGLKDVRVHSMPLSEFLGRREPSETWDCISWKALKLKTVDLLKLRTHMHAQSQLWMFHGRAVAVEEPQAIEKGFTIIRIEKVPGTKDSHLSCYQPNPSIRS